MKIAHEAPVSILNKVDEVTDYSYCLVHLLDENEEYKEHFLKTVRKCREVILDNSIFELGTAFNGDVYLNHIEKLNPTWYIIPDVLEDSQQTVKNVFEWVRHKLPQKSIGVVQGKSVEEIIWCYQEIEPLVDKVAISFDYSYFIDEEMNGVLPTKYHHYMFGRDALINQLLNVHEIINTEKPHHLLGCSLPQEFSLYRDYKWIDSVDTSNPVVAGIQNIHYNGPKGLEDKPSVKLFTLINYQPTSDQLSTILYNIECFRFIANDTE
jgi:hypothetical protein